MSKQRNSHELRSVFDLSLKSLQERLTLYRNIIMVHLFMLMMMMQYQCWN